MKKLLFLTLITLCITTGYAQDYPSPFILEKIDSAIGTKTELFINGTIPCNANRIVIVD